MSDNSCAGCGRIISKDEAEFLESQKRVVAVRPEAADPNSLYNKRMVDMDQEWIKSRDARAHDPRKPELIAEILDLELELYGVLLDKSLSRFN